MGTITLDLTHRIVGCQCLLVAWYLVIGMAHADEHIKLFFNLIIHIYSEEVNGMFHNGVGLKGNSSFAGSICLVALSL